MSPRLESLRLLRTKTLSLEKRRPIGSRLWERWLTAQCQARGKHGSMAVPRKTVSVLGGDVPLYWFGPRPVVSGETTAAEILRKEFEGIEAQQIPRNERQKKYPYPYGTQYSRWLRPH